MVISLSWLSVLTVCFLREGFAPYSGHLWWPVCSAMFICESLGCKHRLHCEFFPVTLGFQYCRLLSMFPFKTSFCSWPFTPGSDLNFHEETLTLLWIYRLVWAQGSLCDMWTLSPSLCLCLLQHLSKQFCNFFRKAALVAFYDVIFVVTAVENDYWSLLQLRTNLRKYSPSLL